MERVAIMMCLTVACSTAPVQEIKSNEQIAAHANEALRLMEMYRLYQQQGLVANPFLPAAEIPGAETAVESPPVEPAEAAPVQVDAAPAQAAPPPPPAADAQLVGEASEEEEDTKAVSKAAAPLKSEETEEVEETEEGEDASAVKADAPAAYSAAAPPAVPAQKGAPKTLESAVGEVAAEAAAQPATSVM